MNKLMITVATVALLAGETAASAQTADNGGAWRRNTVGAQGSQDQGSPTQVAQNTRRDRTGGQGQTTTQTQGAPDYAAYYQNNPDLQRAYEANKAAEQARGESPTAFAQRHYQEHGQAEGRALPRSAVTVQPAQQQTQPSRQQGGAYTGQYNGGSGRSAPRDNQPYQRQDRTQSDQRQYNDRAGRGDQGPNRNWQDYNRRYGDQNRSVRRQNGNVWDGHAWRPEQFNRRNYNRNWNAQRRFRLSPYYRPNGWFYQRWTFGQILPFVFFSQNYWIDSYWSYGLPTPPYGCEWVRYGDDALLVDVESGEILQVVYGLFY